MPWTHLSEKEKKHGLHIMDGCSHSNIDSDFSEACILAARMLGGLLSVCFLLVFTPKEDTFGVKTVQF